MKYLQIVGTVICVLLTVIAVELKNLKPITMSEYRETLKKLGDGTKAYNMLPAVAVTPEVSIVHEYNIQNPPP